MYTVLGEEDFESVVDDTAAHSVILSEFEGHAQSLLIVADKTVGLQSYTPAAGSWWPLHAAIFTA